MKKLLLLLLPILLIVGYAFGDTITYKIADHERTLTNVKYTKAGNGKVYFIAHNKEISRNCNDVLELTDNDGNSIEYDCKVIINEPLKENTIENTFNKSQSHNYLIESGQKFIKFKKTYYSGAFLSLLGQVVTLTGISNSDNTIMLAGFGCAFLGGVISLLSFNDIGEAGQDLINAGTHLKTEQAKKKAKASNP
tara:strand:- start:345 stop:926 length:582 start_codon:yes stop_codon:yes gene_type:complete